MDVEIIQDTGYGLIPKRIMRDKNLSIQAKAIYSYLASFAGNTGKAFPSVSLIIGELSISRNTFYKYMNELKDVGAVVIKKERSEGKFCRNIYYLNNDIKTPCTKSSYTVKPDTVSSYTAKPDTVNVDTISNSIKSNSSISNSINKKNSASNDTQHISDIKDEEISKKKKDRQLREGHFEKMWKLYPVKKGKGQVSDSKKKEIFKVGDEFARCISRYKKQVEAERKDGFKELRFQQGSTFFNSGYIDYLDENYEGRKLDGRTNISSKKAEEEFTGECEGDKLYERARRKFDIKPIPDEEIPF